MGLGTWLKNGVAEVLLRGAEEYLLSEPQRARDYALRAYDLYRMTGDLETIASAADLAAQALYLLADYRLSRRYAAAAYRFYRRRGDSRAICMILAILSGTAQRLGRETAALVYAERSYALATQLDDPVLITTALGNLSQMLTVWGRFEEAVDYAGATIGLMEKHGLTRSRNYVIALNTLGILYTHLNQDTKARERFRQALAIADEAGDASMQSMLTSNLGSLFWRYRDWKNARTTFDKALEIAIRNDDHVREGEIALNLARTLIELEEFEEAAPMLLSASLAARRSKNQELEWLVATTEARLLERQGRFLESLQAAEKALLIAAGLGTDAHRGAALHTLARCCILVQDLERAADLLEQAADIEEVIRDEVRTDALLTSMFDVQVTAYEDLQWVQVQLGRYAEALVTAERGRARVLARRISERDAERDSPPDFQEIRRIASELNTTFIVLSVMRVPAHLFDCEPDLHGFVWGVPLDPAMPIAFHRTPSWRDSPPQYDGRPHSVEEWVMDVSETDRRWMHDWFIEPVAHALPADPSAVVTIVPMGPLAVMPFAAACDSNGVLFVERHPIALSPSIQTLRLAMKRKSRGEGALVVGDPSEDLESAKAEAGLVARMPATLSLIGEAATHATVVQSMPGKWLLHFASHAEFDTNDAASYHGVLKLSDRDLTAEEIRVMSLDAELVVLSACDTGQGRIASDGVLGLSRSFILAGARSVVATLWKIPDEATRLLIEQFYERLAGHGHKAQALQEAMLHMKAMPAYSTPYHWAAFVLTGDASTVPGPNRQRS